MKNNIAVQLYSLRERVDGDFPGLLKKVAGLGYGAVEFAGFHGLKARELKNILDGTGLTSAASHTAADLFQNALTETLEYNAEIGTKYVVVPHFPFAGKEDYLRMAERFAEWAAEAKKYGLGFGYHNHAEEIRDVFDGERGIDIILKDKNVNFQADVYWIKSVGLEPAEFLRAYCGRLPVIHLKDMRDTETKEMTEVGTGVVGIGDIIKNRRDYRTEWFTVEQDRIKGDEFESLGLSFKNVERLLSETADYTQVN